MTRISKWARIGMLLVLACTNLVNASHSHASVRIKDIAYIQGQRQHALVGYGIVTGLAGTGDSPGNKSTRQSIANLLAQFNLSVPADGIASRNVAVVMLSASLPAFAKPGDAVDVTVTSLGDAHSVVGGNLIQAPLKGPDGRIYALAQGPLTVGGYKYDASGNVIQKNHPTAAVIPGGATVEVSPPSVRILSTDQREMAISLQAPDYTTAGRIAEAINREMGAVTAKPIDAQSVTITIPEKYNGNIVDLIRRIEVLDVRPDQRARVVINERTGTVVSGASVQISPVAISYGDLRVSVVSENNISQPLVIGSNAPGVNTALYSNTRLDVQEQNGGSVLTKSGGTVADLVQALTKLKTNTRDIVSILKALKAAGSLHAELLVQ